MSNSRAFCLVDTNILLYALNALSPYHTDAKTFLQKNIPHGNLAISLQNLTEFYSLLTNPRIFQKPFQPKDARVEIEKIVTKGHYKIIVPLKKTPTTIIQLLKRYPAKGAEIHDVHLAAVMVDNGIQTIYTKDTRIFSLVHLTAIDPLS